jgi:hypothetical protein
VAGIGASSSAIVTVAAPGDPTEYDALALNVTTTVSSPSFTLSSIGVTVIVAVDALVGITTLVGIV